MRRTLGRCAVTLVEVLVALAVIAVNVAAWAAAIQLLVIMARSIAVLTVPPDADDVVLMCALAALAPWRVGAWRRRPESLPLADRRGLRGLTLVEVLVALAVGVMALVIAAVVSASAVRINRDVQHHADASIVAAALPALLAEVVQVAGRRLGEDSCGIQLADAGGRLVIRSAKVDGVVDIDELLAARDGAGRPALYLRRVPHSRQPWVEDVTRFRVLDVVEDDDGRAMRVVIAVERQGPEQHFVFGVELPHRPCVESIP